MRWGEQPNPEDDNARVLAEIVVPDVDVTFSPLDIPLLQRLAAVNTKSLLMWERDSNTTPISSPLNSRMS